MCHCLDIEVGVMRGEDVMNVMMVYVRMCASSYIGVRDKG